MIPVMRRLLVLSVLLVGCGGGGADPFGGEDGGRSGSGGGGGSSAGGTGGGGGAGPVACAPRAADAVYAWTYTWTAGQHDSCRTTAPTTLPGGPGGVPSVYTCPPPADLTSCAMTMAVSCTDTRGNPFTFTGSIAWSPDGRTCAGEVHLQAELPQGQTCDSFFAVTCARQ
jgi:hypothetical protein